MIDVTILWDDGAMFIVTTDLIDPDDAVEHVWDSIHAGDIVRGRWAGPEGVQDQVRLARLEQRGIRGVMTDIA